MDSLDLGDVVLHYADTGPKEAPAVVFSNSLGTDFRLWDGILPHMPEGLRVIRYDTRGHGLSTCPAGPYSMGALIHDAERLIEGLAVRDCVFVGLSIGGMIAQGLAAKRLDLVRAVVLSNTAPKIGTRTMWEERIAMVETQGLQAMSGAIMERWFSKPFREGPQVTPWRRMVETTPPEGYRQLFGGDRGHGFLRHHGCAAPARAGDRRVRGWIDAARSGAGSGGADPRCAL